MSEYEKYNLKQVINASGKMTILGVSKYREKAIEAQKFGGENFFEMADLVDRVGEHLASLLEVEGAHVVSSASAGIAQSVAAIIGQGSAYHLYHPYTDKITSREIVLPKGQNVDYGTPVEVMVELGGGKVVEAGYANMCSADHLAQQITDETAGILYIQSHHAVQKSMLTVEEAAEVAKKHGLPLIVDAAAESDLFKYVQAGADLVIYSGAKSFEGPSSGLVIGDGTLIEWTKLQSNGIGRAMKIGKENILGLAAAIENFLEDGAESGEKMQERMAPLISGLNEIPNLSAEIVQDAAGRDIYRASVKVGANSPKNAAAIATELKNGQPAIYTRDYQVNNEIIEIDVRAVNVTEMAQIVERFTEILK